MKTKIGGWEDIKLGVSLLKNGEIVAFPTETVYGLGANIYDESAIKKIFIAKGRPQDNPLIAHIHCPDLAIKIAEDIPAEAYLLWEMFSPGPLTLVLNKKNLVPDIVTAGLNTVAIRIPNNELALELLKECNFPIVAPSANISGRLSPTSAQHVLNDLEGKIPLILDSGECLVGIESTVLDLTKSIPTILRPGFISEKDLALVLGKVTNHKGEILIAQSPGMKYKHYAPICQLIVAKNVSEATERCLLTEDTIILGRKSFVEKIVGCKTMSLGVTPKECMRNYYKYLRDIENKYSCIIIEDFSNIEGFEALSNRVLKSSHNYNE